MLREMPNVAGIHNLKFLFCLCELLSLSCDLFGGKQRQL